MGEDRKDYQRTTLDSIGQGALIELFDVELQKVMKNIDDLNCEAKAKRSITIEIEFRPDGTRQAIQVFTNVKAKVAAPKKAETTIFVVHDGSGEPFAINNNMRQPELFKT